MPRALIFTSGPYGDRQATWSEENDEKVLPAIQAMLDKKYSFFILDSSGDRVPVTAVEQAKASRHIILPDGLEELRVAGLITSGMVKIEEINNTGELARTAAEVAAHDTVVVPPPGGG